VVPDSVSRAAAAAWEPRPPSRPWDVGDWNAPPVPATLQTNQELSKYIPVYVDINTDADNPAGEDLQLPLGAQHSGTNGLVHFTPSQLDPNQAALQVQLLAEWTYFAHTGNPSAPQTPAWALYSGSLRVRLGSPRTAHDVLRTGFETIEGLRTGARRTSRAVVKRLRLVRVRLATPDGDG
jgi:hypothetical protein